MRYLAALIPLALVVSVWTSAAFAAAPKQQQFKTPEEAAEMLVAALKAGDKAALMKIFGAQAKPLIDSGDPVADRAAWDGVVQSYEQGHSFASPDDTTRILQTGTDNWPMPIPLVLVEGKWHFDSAAGQQEILDRRIGKNELSAIQSCLAYVDAQREYNERNPTNAALPHYAQKVTSSPGKRDGLYWETDDDESPSPLGPVFGHARGQGYSEIGKGKGIPYHGYYYRILTAQGPDASGGKYDYVVRGTMLGGFALVAYPAEYGASGVMTFVVNHDGVVFEKDLGPSTAKLAREMKAFNPDSTWTKLAPS